MNFNKIYNDASKALKKNEKEIQVLSEKIKILEEENKKHKQVVKDFDKLRKTFEPKNAKDDESESIVNQYVESDNDYNNEY